jgi:plasmid stabilization system protein ParE
MRFTLSSQAEQALAEAWDFYFERGGARLADRILAEIHDAIERLVDWPTLGHFRPDLTDKPFRFYRVYSIFLIYDPASSPLHIALVFHAAQDIRTRMSDEQEKWTR